MVEINGREGMLSPYRVLDLADENGVFCGKILGHLRADVIKIERPRGDSARNIGPFYHDNPEWTISPDFVTLTARKANEDELDKLVEGWTINHSAEEVMQMMQGAGVPAGILETAEDLILHDPQLKHRHLYYELDHPEVGKYIAPRPVFMLSKSPCEVRRALSLVNTTNIA